MWIIKPFELFSIDLIFVSYNFGVGLRIDWTWLFHILTYGWLIYPMYYLWMWITEDSDKAFLLGFIIATIVLFVVEINQGFSYTYECGYFGIGDIISGVPMLYAIYLLLK